MAAIRDIDAIQDLYAERYRWFQNEFCDLDDGYAAARLADRMLVAGGDLAPGQAHAPAVGTVGTRHTGRAMTPARPRVSEWFSGPRTTTGLFGVVPTQPSGDRDYEGVIV